MSIRNDALRVVHPTNALAPPPFGGLTLRGLFEHQPVERFQVAATIFWEGDAAIHVFAVDDGVLRIVRILGDGRRIITGFVFPGDLVGISLHRRYPFSAEAVTLARVRRLARVRLQEEIGRSPQLRPELFGLLADEMIAAQDQMVLLARKSAEERVCSFLLLLARRTCPAGEEEAVIDIPMTRLDIADYLGLTVETVSRTITKLTARGLISPAGRHSLKISDMARLRDIDGWSDTGIEYGPLRTARPAVWPQ